ncbi:uncharacterized protein LOC141833793 [Curcuma longa]|uniref:uncharacterized protein LOC141833793 n=1 Tax=Curcuma longa TaxID=136217 RepID=UPI003D9F2A8D
MASGGRVIFKRAAHGRRRRQRSKASEDEDDEEYVMEEEEEEEEESSDEPLDASDASEEEFVFGGSTSDSDDGDRMAAEADEDEEISVGPGPKRLKCSSGAKKRPAKKPRVSYYEKDDDYKAEEEEEEEEEDEEEEEEEGGGEENEEEEILSLRKRSKKRNSPAVRSHYQKAKGSDYEEEDMEEEEEAEEKEILSFRKRGKNRNASVVRSSYQKPKGSYFEDDLEEEEGEEKQLLSLRKKGRNRNSPSIRSHHQKTKGSDYEEEEMEEEDEEDEDFSPDEQDLADEEAFMPPGLKKRGQKKKGGKMQKLRNLRQKKMGNRCQKRSEDDDFIVKDRVAASRKTKKSKKTTWKKSSTSKVIKKKSVEESDTSEFDFLTSDDDFVEDAIMLDEPRNKSRNIQKTNRSMKRRQIVSLEESVSSSDGDYNISEDVLRDLRVDGIADQPQTDRIIAQIKGAEKGKEKENEDSGRPLCGICLTEEHKTTVRGVLNSCTHFFCFACIMEWSKVESRCPVCKRRFGTITKTSRSEPGFGLRKAVIKVEKRDQVYQPSEEEIRRMLDPYENVVCIECHKGGDDSLMLLCDICDSPAHTYCVGLGREVPEGNWYCECCRSAGDDSSYLQNQDFGADQADGNTDASGRHNETEVLTLRGNTNLYRSSQPTLHEIDLNVSPRSMENCSSMSQPYGVGPSTVLGRRAIQQRIRIILSNSRSQIFQQTRVSQGNIGTDVMTSEIGRRVENLRNSQGLNSWNSVPASEQCYQNSWPSL